MRMNSKLVPGQILGGRYQIMRVIGSGGMSHVHLAEDLRLPGKQWAVKESVTSGREYGSVQAEAELLISLNHRRLPRIADFYAPDCDGYSYLVMDYIEGMTIAQYMQANPGPVPGEILLRFAKQLLEVLQYLHGHHPPIVYRDLKPSNIMLTPQHELVLIDFGIARNYVSGGTEDTVKLGTVGFAAPEQYGSGQSRPESDLYGLGALLLYMATGGRQTTWQKGIERQLAAVVPGRMIPVIQRLLQPRPEDRYPDALSVINVLSNIPTGRERNSDGEHPGAGTTVVAIMGVAGGLGTTHASLSVASYLSGYGSTAWVDYAPDSRVFERMRHMAEMTGSAREPSLQGHSFLWKGIHFSKRPETGALRALNGGDYRYVVLDLGTGNERGALEEFAKSPVPLLIASGADWRIEEVLLWKRRSGLELEDKCKILLSLADRAAAAMLEEVLQTARVYPMPYQSSPFTRDHRMEELMTELLKPITGGESVRKRNGLFQRR
ncbi:serine/threonine protein kinase [Paenibacillus sp. sgz500958]|uniref:serine/threonine protein kinase n=1 Tax=Paenibacillus sp. sgz500958 TaxID=3242475 RepID=UPI0036D22089